VNGVRMPSSEILNRAIDEIITARQEFARSFGSVSSQNDVIPFRTFSGIVLARKYAQRVKDSLAYFFSFLPVGSVSRWVVAAVGGLGRGEMSFCSDIDILFLHERRLSKSFHDYIRSLVYGLWDVGLDVGHNTAPLSVALRLSSKDFTILTNHLTADFIAGDRDLYEKWRTRLLGRFGIRRTKKFVKQLQEYISRRHHRFAESSYLLEPHIKEGPGGLRDLHVIQWAGAVFWNAADYKGIPAEVLPDYEREWLIEAEAFLWELRLALHTVSKRANDQLLMAYQHEIGTRWFSDNESDGGRQVVEEFMRQYYLHSARVRRVTTFFLERLHDMVFRRKSRTRRRSLTNGELFLENGHICFSDPGVVEKNPLLLMKIFAEAARRGVHFHHETGRIIRVNLEYIDDSVRESRKAAELFFEVLCNVRHGADVLRTMLETGVLTRFIPEFKNVRYRVQYDIYHLFTVDEHLIRTVGELHQLAKEEKNGLFYGLNRNDRKLLFLAGLLHDIGKGMGKGHAEIGANLVVGIARRLGLSEKEARDLQFLVKHHLLIPEIALKRDLSDEKPIVKCATEVKSVRLLKLLYLLSIADSRATGPRAWNAWRAGLMAELYFKVYRFLTRKDWRGDLARQIRKTKQAVLELCQSDEEKSIVAKWLEELSFRYLISQSPPRIYEHFAMEREFERRGGVVFNAARRKGDIWDVTVVARDRPGLFSIIAGVLWAAGVNILAADIFTRTTGIAVDVITVDMLPDPMKTDKLWAKVHSDLSKAIEIDDYLKKLLERRKSSPFLKKDFVPKRPDRVVIDENSSDFYTVIEVYTWDRPGVLYAITDVLYNFGLSIQLAKISTPGAQVADVFYVTTTGGEKLNNPRLAHQIKEAILQRLTTID